MTARFGPEGSQPSDDDGLFDSQDMPTVDGEMADADSTAEGTGLTDDEDAPPAP